MIDEIKAQIGYVEGLCISCKQPFTDKNVHTEAGWRETKISNTCEDCFDEMFKEED